MTTALEGAARAVLDTCLLSGGCPDKLEAAREVARAVLLAVRESPGLPETITAFGRCPGYAVTPNDWMVSMIDAILADGGE